MTGEERDRFFSSVRRMENVVDDLFFEVTSVGTPSDETSLELDSAYTELSAIVREIMHA